MTKRAYARGLAGAVVTAAAFLAGWMGPINSAHVSTPGSTATTVSPTPMSTSDDRGGFELGGIAYAADHPKPNKCGCYRDSAGGCFCGKKGACACPGDCEPKGCDEKRAKQLDKEIAAETKKAAAGGGHASKEKESARGRDSSEGASNDSKSHGKEKPAAHLSSAQKKELLRLLDAYLAEHPEGKTQTIDEVRIAVIKSGS